MFKLELKFHNFNRLRSIHSNHFADSHFSNWDRKDTDGVVIRDELSISTQCQCQFVTKRRAHCLFIFGKHAQIHSYTHSRRRTHAPVTVQRSGNKK